MRESKYYIIDFKATITGPIRIKAQSKRQALEILKRAQYVWDQVEDQLHDAHPQDFDVVFVRESLTEDEDQGSDPYTESTT
jgi:hypothetical protein